MSLRATRSSLEEDARRAIIAALLIVGVGVVLGATVFRADIAQATGLAQSVTVDNTTTNPVPVREQNLDGGNIKVHEQGTALVRDADSPARQPFQTLGSANIGPGEHYVQVNLAQVPAGKRLVIEYASGSFSTPDGQQITTFSVNASQFGQFVPVQFEGHDVSSDSDTSAAGEAIRLYADPGESVFALVTRTDTTDTAFVYVRISGYLVDV